MSEQDRDYEEKVNRESESDNASADTDTTQNDMGSWEDIDISDVMSEESLQEEADEEEEEKKKKRAAGLLFKTRSVKAMNRSASFWNKLDWVNKFRHWYVGVGSFASGIFRVIAAWQTIAVLGVILAACYVFAAFYTGKGEFVISLDRPMANEGFILSEDTDFSEWLVLLKSDAVEDATNINITDIDQGVLNMDGCNNGRNYVAYTFYLKNKTREMHDYEYTINIKNKYKGADKATWIMVYQNGKQIIYAAPNKAGHEECQYSKWRFPFVDDAVNPEYQLSTISDEEPGYITQDVVNWHEFQSLDGIYELHTVPFQSENIVCTQIREDIDVNEYDKYTVVIWLEGEDPECVNDILGGFVEFGMTFSIVD